MSPASLLRDASVKSQNRPLSDWSFVSAGSSTSCGIRQDGSLWGWGGNTFGELGDGTKNSVRTPPVRIGDAHWRTVAVAYFHSAGIQDDRSLWVWGGAGGACYVPPGGKDIQTYLSPVRVGSENDWVDVGVGNGFTVARKQDVTLWGWGFGPSGSGPVFLPVQVGSENNWGRP